MDPPTRPIAIRSKMNGAALRLAMQTQIAVNELKKARKPSRTRPLAAGLPLVQPHADRALGGFGIAQAAGDQRKIEGRAADAMQRLAQIARFGDGAAGEGRKRPAAGSPRSGCRPRPNRC